MLRIGGDAIANQTGLTLWAEIQDVDYLYVDGNFTMTHEAASGYETAECRYKFNTSATEP